MIKYMGIILISGAISMLGAHKASLVRRDMHIQKAMLEFIMFIKTSIENGAGPLSEIYRMFGNKTLEKTDFIYALKNSGSDAFSYAFERISTHFPEKLSVLYTALGESLGKSRFAHTECEILERYIQQIRSVQDSLSAENESKIQLYKHLGVLAGILAALILI